MSQFTKKLRKAIWRQISFQMELHAGAFGR